MLFPHPVSVLGSSSKENALTLPSASGLSPLVPTLRQYAKYIVQLKKPTYIGPSPVIGLSHNQCDESAKENLSGTPFHWVESTLRYGRRPDYTNRMISPLAVFPTGSTKRHELNGASSLSNFHGSPPFAHRSDVSDATELIQDGDTKRNSSVYDEHSTSLVAANAYRAASATVDFSNAMTNPRSRSPQLHASLSTAALRPAEDRMPNDRAVRDPDLGHWRGDRCRRPKKIVPSPFLCRIEAQVDEFSRPDGPSDFAGFCPGFGRRRSLPAGVGNSLTSWTARTVWSRLACCT